MKIGILTNEYKDPGCITAGRVAERLQELGCETVLIRQTNAFIIGNSKEFAYAQEVFQDCDLIMSMGGDGTFLKAVHVIYNFDIPIIGVNLGSLGFLTELHPNELEADLQQIAAAEYTIENRLVIECTVDQPDQNKVQHAGFALNEVLLSRGNSPRILPIELWIDGAMIELIPGDGLMVSTPTGSTGYAMAAGGPIIQPQLELMLITPLCPHTLHNRSYIISPESVVELKMRFYPYTPILSVDGQHDFELISRNRITIRRSTRPLRIARLHEPSFFKTLPEKILGRGFVANPEGSIK